MHLCHNILHLYILLYPWSLPGGKVTVMMQLMPLNVMAKHRGHRRPHRSMSSQHTKQLGTSTTDDNRKLKY